MCVHASPGHHLRDEVLTDRCRRSVERAACSGVDGHGWTQHMRMRSWGGVRFGGAFGEDRSMIEPVVIWCVRDHAMHLLLASSCCKNQHFLDHAKELVHPSPTRRCDQCIIRTGVLPQGIHRSGRSNVSCAAIIDRWQCDDPSFHPSEGLRIQDRLRRRGA